MRTGFKEYDIDFYDLPSVLKMRGRYSNFYYRDKIRKAENYIPNVTNALILDIDDGATIDQFKNRLKNYAYALGTTKSHQNDKNGLVCDRFRIILPTETAVSLNSAQFSQMMSDVFIDFPECDRACKDTSRFYSGYYDAEVFLNEGNLFDWEKYWNRSVKREELRKLHAKQKLDNNKSVDKKDIENALKKIDPDINYENWIRIGMAIKTELGDGGFYLFDSWSQGGSKYKSEKETMLHWRSFKRNDVTIGSLFFIANRS